MDIKGFFDALDHTLVLRAVSKYTTCKWVLLYIERWLKADVVLPNGDILSRLKGTPQGGVISPLLANIFLHLGFDKWMQEHFPCIHFERYADDIVVHCRSLKQLKFVESKVQARFAQCKLELCPEKTKIVYCKDSSRNGSYVNESFDFLGYTFRPRSSRAKTGEFFVSFSAAVSRKALKAMRTKLKEHPMIKGCYSQSVDELAKAINPMIQGWINYYGTYCKSAMSSMYDYINEKIIRWAKRKYKHLRRRQWRAGRWLRDLYMKNPTLFAHWRIWSWVSE
jgi:RNA-directed DNA polymerase